VQQGGNEPSALFRTRRFSRADEPTAETMLGWRPIASSASLSAARAAIPPCLAFFTTTSLSPTFPEWTVPSAPLCKGSSSYSRSAMPPSISTFVAALCTADFPIGKLNFGTGPRALAKSRRVDACPVEHAGAGPDIVRAAVAAASEIDSPDSGRVMTGEAVASASRSNRSAGSLTVSPLPFSAPATGPWTCWMTWVSSWTRMCLSARPSPMTTWFPEV